MTELVGGILRSPSEEFMRFLLKELSKTSPTYKIEGQINDKKIQRFEPIVKKAIQSSLVELMTRSISQEMSHVHEDLKPTIQDDIAEVEDEEEPDVEESKVETTAEELEAFGKVKEIAATSKLYQLEVKYRDVVSYFGVNAGKTTWWFLRFYLSSKRKSFVTRLSIEDVKILAPEFEVQEMSTSLGDAASRVIISSVGDLDKLSSLILKCYEVEAAKHQGVKLLAN
ncbi:hypothetical protein H6F93_28050 [Leptolyngbya sp. FACHB-671]|uniref:hypothetical protein n=1 Tax=Leptolyngbya sp. FACHB-671 TaxID=2692812 RepID=UPI0016849FAC|nr:hypothetical protein [Leptolyngbya sp. FACHB-671]MBD2071324.1 hypothetical protein [Leptolyngbya sp. FACHB-671]